MADSDHFGERLGQVSLTVLGLIGACAFLLTHADWRDS